MIYEFRKNRPVWGKDTYISETAIVIGNVEIGDNCYIGHGAVLRGDYGKIVIGNGTAVEEAVVIHAPPGETGYIGNKVTLGHGAVIHGKNIGDNAVIGMGAILSIMSDIGEGAIVAEGSVVKMRQNIEAMKVAAGNPAAVVRDIREKDMEMWSYVKQLYMDLAAEYNKNGLIPVKTGETVPVSGSSCKSAEN